MNLPFFYIIPAKHSNHTKNKSSQQARIDEKHAWDVRIFVVAEDAEGVEEAPQKRSQTCILSNLRKANAADGNEEAGGDYAFLERPMYLLRFLNIIPMLIAQAIRVETIAIVRKATNGCSASKHLSMFVVIVTHKLRIKSHRSHM